MHIAVYAISKNEAAFVPRWLAAIREADSITVLDTGSTDSTVDLLRTGGATVHTATLSPWRFDDARNLSLALVPPHAEICICLDLDEVMQPGWRAGIEAAWKADTTRLRYPYTWSWQADGSPGVQYYADKIHARHGGRWRLPCHETLHFATPEAPVWTDAVRIHHHPDDTKSRANYLPLLALSVAENPDCDRTRHYYARELVFHGRHAESAVQFRHHLAMSSAKWNAEKSRSLAYLAQCEPAAAHGHLLHACALTPDQREPWYELARHYRAAGDTTGARYAITQALKVPASHKFYLSIPECYDGTLERWLSE
jgi:hypothetical protein